MIMQDKKVQKDLITLQDISRYMLNKQKWVIKAPRNLLHNTSLTLNANDKGMTVAERHWIIEKKTAELNQSLYLKTC